VSPLCWQNRRSHLLGAEGSSSPFPDEPGPPLSDGAGSWVSSCRGTAAVVHAANAVFSHRSFTTGVLPVALSYRVTTWDAFAPVRRRRGQ